MATYRVWGFSGPHGSRVHAMVAYRSSDGGATFRQAGASFGSYRLGRITNYVPMLAASPPGYRHTDRLFAVWCTEDGDARVEVAYSDDRGDTWKGNPVLNAPAPKGAAG